MGFKTGAVVGFAAGYYLGTKAGRERYHQINSWIDQARNSDAVTTATEKARDLVDDANDLSAGYSSN